MTPLLIAAGILIPASYMLAYFWGKAAGRRAEFFENTSPLIRWNDCDECKRKVAE